jgi:hypothetical protein
MILIVVLACLCSGCAFVDWHGVWFGCPKGQIEKPATRSMFGKVKYPSSCEKVPVSKGEVGHE